MRFYDAIEAIRDLPENKKREIYNLKEYIPLPYLNKKIKEAISAFEEDKALCRIAGVSYSNLQNIGEVSELVAILEIAA